MTHIKRFREINESFTEYIDKSLLQQVIDGMKPRKGYDEKKFKLDLRDFNSSYPVSSKKSGSSIFGKQVADWVDIDLVQDVIDRMNIDDYKEKLRSFLL